VFDTVIRVVVFGFGLACAAFAGWWFFLAATRDRPKVMRAPRLVRFWVIALPTQFAITGGLFMAAALAPAYQKPLLIGAGAVWLLRELLMRATAARVVEQTAKLDG